MGGVFACPECGSEVKLKGLSPGRQTRCGWCEALVEVPFIPRNLGAKKSRKFARRRAPWLIFAWVGVAALAIVIAAAGGAHLFQSRDRSAKEKALSEETASAKASEASGRLGEALSKTGAALELARKLDPPNSERITKLVKTRDDLDRRDCKSILAELEHADPSRAVGDCLTLLARIEKRPVLADLEDSVRAALERASRKSVENDLEASRQALVAGRPEEVLKLCDRVSKTALHLDPETRKAELARTRTVVAQVAEKYGIVIKSVRGQFGLGTSAAYSASIQPLLTDILKARGYLPCPSSSDWCALWESAAPYQLQIDVAEDMSEKYMQSKNRVSQLSARMVLTLRGTILWDRSAIGRTQVPLPNLPAYQGARIAAGDHHSPDFERLLYDNAYAILLDQLGRILRAFPECGKSGHAIPGAPKAS